MFSRVVPPLVILSALSGSYAALSDDGLSAALTRFGLNPSQVVTAVTLGSDSSGHTSYSIAFAEPFTFAPTATAPDTTLSAAATVVEGSTDAHVYEIVTAGSTVIEFNEDCALSDGVVACTLVGKNTAGSVIESTAVMLTLTSSPGTAATASASATQGKNGAGRLGAAGASVLAVIAAGVTLVGMV